METPSTRKVTATTLVPAAVLGTAVRTTILLTTGGAVSVIEEAPAVVPPVPLLPPELVLVPAPLLLLPELVLVPAPLLLLELVLVPAPLLLLELVLVPAPLLLLELVLVPAPLLLLPVPVVFVVVVAVVAVDGVVVMSVPQADSVTDSVAMTLTAVCLERISLKVSYITVSPFKQ